jgi:DNA mismatch repair ATPase MutS
MDWKVVKQASPGNLQDLEDELGGHIENSPIILSVKVSAKASEARNVGVCFADASVRELGVTEFLDNDLYSNFESLLIQLGVKECLIQADGAKKDIELNKLRTIADNCGCAVAERAAADFGVKDIEQDLPRRYVGLFQLRTVPTLSTRSHPVHEVRCGSFEGAELDARAEGWSEEHEFVWSPQPLQNTDRKSIALSVAQAATDGSG